MKISLNSSVAASHVESSPKGTGRRNAAAWLAACGLAACGLLLTGSANASPCRGGRDSKCVDAEITGASQVDPTTGAFVGQGGLELDGKLVAIEWVSVITSVVAAPDGTLTLLGSHHITSRRNNAIDFTTSDVVTAVPMDASGNYAFSSHLTVVSGKGRVKQGSLDVEGRVDLVLERLSLRGPLIACR